MTSQSYVKDDEQIDEEEDDECVDDFIVDLCRLEDEAERHGNRVQRRRLEVKQHSGTHTANTVEYTLQAQWNTLQTQRNSYK